MTDSTGGRWAIYPYPGLVRALAVPNGHGGWHGRRHWTRGTAEHRQPDAARFGGAAVHPHRVLEAPVRPGWRRAWKHSSGHRGVEFSQIHIPHRPHGLHTSWHAKVVDEVQMQKYRIFNQAKRRWVVLVEFVNPPLRVIQESEIPVS